MPSIKHEFRESIQKLSHEHILNLQHGISLVLCERDLDENSKELIEELRLRTTEHLLLMQELCVELLGPRKGDKTIYDHIRNEDA